MEKKYKLMLAAFSGVPFLMVLGNSMLIPEFPRIKSALDISQFQMSLMITLFSASAGITIPFLGYLSDRVGRKKVIVPSIILYGIGGLISGLAALLIKNPYVIILVGRVVQGIGAAGTTSIVMAFVGDIFQSTQRSEALGIIEASNGFGKVMSPILGSAIALISWIALFFSYAFLAIPVALGVWILSKEPKSRKEQKGQNVREYLRKIGEIFRKEGRSLAMCFLAGLLILLILFGLLAHVSDIIETRYHVKGIIKGLVMAIPIALMSLVAYLTGWELKKLGRYYKHSMTLGLLLVFAGSLVFPLAASALTYILFLSIIGLGNGLVLPALNTLITSAAALQQRGGITSLYGSVRFLGVAVGPPAYCLLNEVSETVMFYTGGGLALITAILAYLFIQEKGLTPGQHNN
ncbi:MAG: MFS transporter [Halanaerobium sp.]|nr:MFS transporter [Halanaerobium sp.]